jgi:hypothetical protein
VLLSFGVRQQRLGVGILMGTAEGRDTGIGQWPLWLAVLMIAGGVLIYLWFVGNHEHVLEINTPEGKIRIISNRSLFRVSLPGLRDVQLHSLSGYDGLRMQGLDHIAPMQIEGRGIIRTSQQVDIPSARPLVEFSVNRHDFKIEDGKVQAAGQVWHLAAGSIVEIIADRLR